MGNFKAAFPNGSGNKGSCSYANSNTGEIRITGANEETQTWKHRRKAGSKAKIIIKPGQVESDDLFGDDDSDSDELFGSNASDDGDMFSENEDRQREAAAAEAERDRKAKIAQAEQAKAKPKQKARQFVVRQDGTCVVENELATYGTYVREKNCCVQLAFQQTHCAAYLGDVDSPKNIRAYKNTEKIYYN